MQGPVGLLISMRLKWVIRCSVHQTWPFELFLLKGDCFQPASKQIRLFRPARYSGGGSSSRSQCECQSLLQLTTLSGLTVVSSEWLEYLFTISLKTQNNIYIVPFTWLSLAMVGLKVKVPSFTTLYTNQECQRRTGNVMRVWRNSLVYIDVAAESARTR